MDIFMENSLKRIFQRMDTCVNFQCQLEKAFFAIVFI